MRDKDSVLRPHVAYVLKSLAFLVIVALTGCGGGGGESAPAAPVEPSAQIWTLTYSTDANGSISGTTPQSVTHGTNGTEITAVPNQDYVFVNWSDGSTANPRIDTGITSNIAVTANFAALRTITASVSGLSGTLVLQNNGGDDLTFNTDGTSPFTVKIANGTGYGVTVKSEPYTQTCTVTGGVGTVTADIAVLVSCVNKSWKHPASLTENNTPDTLTANYPQVAMSANGDAIVVGGGFVSHYRDGTWTSPEFPYLPAHEPRVAMDANGNAIIVWYGYHPTMKRYHIYKSEYRDGVWMHPSSLDDHINPDWGSDTTTTHYADYVQVAMSANGEAIIVWAQTEADATGWYRQIFKSEYRKGGWLHPVSLADHISPEIGLYTDPDNKAHHASRPQVAMDDNGNAVIAWDHNYYRTELSAYKSLTFISQYKDGAWTHPLSASDAISVYPGGIMNTPHVAMDGAGDAIVVWRQNDGTVESVFKSEYRSGTWTHPASLTDNISVDLHAASGSPRVAMGANGDAIIVWEQTNGTNRAIYKSEYRSISGSRSWTHPASTDYISPYSTWYAETPQVAMDATGSAIIVWKLYDGANQQIFKSEWRGTAWSHPASLSDNISPDGQDATIPQVAMDSNGNAFIVWLQSDGTKQQIFKSEYR